MNSHLKLLIVRVAIKHCRYYWKSFPELNSKTPAITSSFGTLIRYGPFHAWLSMAPHNNYESLMCGRGKFQAWPWKILRVVNCCNIVWHHAWPWEILRLEVTATHGTTLLLLYSKYVSIYCTCHCLCVFSLPKTSP